MKRIIFFITIWIGVCFSVAGQISKNVTTKQPDLNMVREGEYDRISLDGVFYTTDVIGHPELPVYIQSFVIPIDAQINGININSLSKLKLAGTYYIYPVQPPIPVSFNDDIGDFRLPDPAIYDSSMPYPNKQAEIISDDIYLGYRIITVRSYPVEYIPQTKELYICNFDFTIDYSINTKQTGSNEFAMQTQSLYRYELNKKNVKFCVENPGAVDDYDTKVQKVIQGKTIIYDFSSATDEKAGLRSQAISVMDEQIPEYIIITNNALKPHFQTLADWKTKKGIFTVIVTTEEINTDYSGSDLQEKIKNYLINACSRWGAGLYVLLGGDINIVPSRLIKGVSKPSLSYPSDRYYSISASNPWSVYIGNVFNGSTSTSIINLLGRIPVSNAQEVTTYTNKVIAYEKANGLGDLNYLKNNLYADAYMEYVNKSDPASGLTNFFHSNIKSYVSSYVPGTINKKFICDNAACIPDPKYTVIPCPAGGNDHIELNRNNFLSCLNTGANYGIGKFHFIYHMDHSGANGMGTSSKDKGQNIIKPDMDNLTNGTSYQIMFSSGCNPANFAYDCIAKHYIMNPNGGGVTFIGNTDVGWQSEHYQVKDFSDAIYTTTNHPSLGRYDIGSAYQNVCEKTSDGKWRLHLLGDPEMQVWTSTPQPLNAHITSNTTVATGPQNISVSVNGLAAGDTARICIWKDTEVYETRKVLNGTHTFDVTPETKGNMHVTVTAHNYFPKEDSIRVNTSRKPNLFVESIEFIDNDPDVGGGFIHIPIGPSSFGNGNGKNDAGETIELQVVIKNNGMTTANSVSVNLSRNSDSIDIIPIPNFSPIISFPPDIPPGESIVESFFYQIDKDMHETLSNSPNPVTFELEMTAQEGVWRKSFNIDVFASDLQQRNKIITNSTSSGFDMQIELQNMGKAPATDLNGYLYYNSDSIAVTFPTIDYQETQLSNTLHIPLLFAPNLNFTLKVENTYEKEWTFNNFNLNKPGNISGLDFSADERNITLTWNTATNVSGYNIYRCNVGANDMEGNYVRLNIAPVSFRFFDDANNLSALTKYYYKVTAVSSSGMEGDAERILTWTSYPQKYLYPITLDASIGRFRSGVNVADVNLDGKKELFAITYLGEEKGWLVGLDYEGNELYDIDNNVTTYSGFAELGYPGWAIPAMADIRREGRYSVIVPTRNTKTSNNKLFCYSVEDQDGNGKPDLLWSRVVQGNYIRGAVVSNIDNNPDGSMEIVVLSVGANIISIFDADGTLLRTIPTVSKTYGAIAVADLDGDGDKEIIIGNEYGIYVWHHDGTDFIPGQQPIYSIAGNGFRFCSSVVVADIDGNGQKKILTSALKTGSTYQGKIYVINTDGTPDTRWGTQTISYQNNSSSQDIAVGDLDGNGKLKVVALGVNEVKIWDNTGALVNTIPVPGLTPNMMNPILADVDGDNEAEIIFGSANILNIYAYKQNGTKVLGFPLKPNETTDLMLCVADVDNDGKNELIFAKGDKVQMWQTNGNPNRIEWGSERHDQFNTGEYYKICDPFLITSNTTWSSSQSICGDIIVKSGTLTVSNNCQISMDASSMIIVMNGANLVIDGGKILNANVKALSGSLVTLKNNGYVKLRKKGAFNICKGAIFDYQQGKIDITQ